MDIHEWALIIFTILGQMAAGGLLVLMVVRAYVSAKAGVEAADRMSDGPLFLVVPVMGLALLASLLHLNNLSNIVKAVPNLGSSWLSREVVIAVTFVVLAAIYTFLQWRKIGTNGVRTVIGWVAALVGMVQTYAMSMVYMIRTQPSWNTAATPITFLVTSLMLGALMIAVALVVTHNLLAKKNAKAAEEELGLLRNVMQGIALTAIVMLGIEFLVLPVYMAYLSTQGSAAVASLNLMVGSYGTTLVLRLALVFLGAGILGAYLYKTASSGKESSIAVLAYSAFALVLVAEVMGRFIFYATHVRIGM